LRPAQNGYLIAFADWLACAVAGAREPAARAAQAAGDGLLERVAAAGAAGHVLDYDDTYVPGLVHLSAPVAPAALLLAAEIGADVGDTLDAYAAGFEATAALARAGHPALYEGGWHPTAVCGGVGAAVAAARLLGLDEERSRIASALAVLRAGGLRAAFGSDGKAIQVGMAAAAGVHSARLAAAGATAPLDRIAFGPAGYEAAFEAPWADPAVDFEAVKENWIKAYPCCLATHGAIDAAAELRELGGADGPVVVVVHPRARQAAMHDDVANGLEAKFSIPYVVAYTFMRGRPGLSAFASVDAEARAFGMRSVQVREDPALGEMEALVEAGGEQVRVARPLGSPGRPLEGDRLGAKVRELAGTRLDGALDDPRVPARELVVELYDL